jgi:hypothetical protein
MAAYMPAAALEDGTKAEPALITELERKLKDGELSQALIDASDAMKRLGKDISDEDKNDYAPMLHALYAHTATLSAQYRSQDEELVNIIKTRVDRSRDFYVNAPTCKNRQVVLGHLLSAYAMQERYIRDNLDNAYVILRYAKHRGALQNARAQVQYADFARKLAARDGPGWKKKPIIQAVSMLEAAKAAGSDHKAALEAADKALLVLVDDYKDFPFVEMRQEARLRKMIAAVGLDDMKNAFATAETAKGAVVGYDVNTTLESSTPAIRNLLAERQEALRTNDSAEAAALLARAREVEPDNTSLELAEAIGKLKAGNPAEAYTAAMRVLNQDPFKLAALDVAAQSSQEPRRTELHGLLRKLLPSYPPEPQGK